MNLSVGIVGLPNVGKSTLFNALLKKQQALAANYPFATIEPNVGAVQVPDGRLVALAGVVEKNEGVNPPLVPAMIEFVDIAGLVAGAHKGEGLGNQFLANIREVNLICHVLRAFEDSDVVLTGNMDPVGDLEVVRTELILKDLETMERLGRSIKKLRDKTIEVAYEKALQTLSDGRMVQDFYWEEKEEGWSKELHLLTAKPEIFAVNVGEEVLMKQPVDELMRKYADVLGVSLESVVIVSAKMEAELAVLSTEEQLEYLAEYGLKLSGLERLGQTAYSKLGLQSFLTAGAKEVRAWTIRKGMTAQEAAGVIHTDFSKKFIKADVIDWQPFCELKGWKKARELGKVRSEGREYVMQDGDVVEFKIGS